ncbi:MAG: hypothetical protein Q8M67_01585 [Bacteroidota bacterium]|nr:hypothetical protein [Bacteroidota bacterium]
MQKQFKIVFIFWGFPINYSLSVNNLGCQHLYLNELIKKMGIIFAFTGIVLGYFGYKLKNKKPKYQVEKTTSGKFVKFVNYEETKKHLQQKIIGIIMFCLGLLIFGAGILIGFF